MAALVERTRMARTIPSSRPGEGADAPRRDPIAGGQRPRPWPCCSSKSAFRLSSLKFLDVDLTHPQPNFSRRPVDWAVLPVACGTVTPLLECHIRGRSVE